jgi:hypothetical protein
MPKLIFHRRQKDGTVQVYDHITRETTRYDGKTFYMQRRKRKDKHKERTYISISQRDKRELQEIAEEYLQQANIIKGHAGIDPLRIGSIQDTALYTFRKYLDSGIDTVKINATASRWLHFAHRGGIMWAQPGRYKGDKYDYTSFYPSICNSDRLFPLGSPATRKIPALEDLDLDIPAIYRVKILGHHPLLKLRPIEKVHQDFVYATNLDLQSADLLGVPWEIAYSTDWNNCMYWETIPGHRIFGKYVDTFFDLKSRSEAGSIGRTTGKSMLNILTGLLAQKHHTYHSLSQSQSPSKAVDITNAIVSSITCEDMCYHEKNSQIFKNPEFAAWAVFITAHGRNQMIETLHRYFHFHLVVHVHTDGFILRSKDQNQFSNSISDSISDPDRLGGLKHEGSGIFTVHHVNKVN